MRRRHSSYHHLRFRSNNDSDEEPHMMGIVMKTTKPGRATWKLAQGPEVRARQGKVLVHLMRDYIALTSLQL